GAQTMTPAAWTIGLLAEGEIGGARPTTYGGVGPVVGPVIGAIALWFATKRPAPAPPPRPAPPPKPAGAPRPPPAPPPRAGPVPRLPHGGHGVVPRRPDRGRRSQHSSDVSQGVAGTPRARTDRTGG